VTATVAYRMVKPPPIASMAVHDVVSTAIADVEQRRLL
jgi:hypothetical protein